MSLQRSTTGVCYALLRFPTKASLAVLRIPDKSPSCTMWVKRFKKYDGIPHSTEQDRLPIAFLISKQVVPYRTCGCTCYPRLSTPKIWSLADSSKHMPSRY
jgi:hypothetical protein